MKELSIFVDESGDFGAYSHHSPYYIIAMVFHDQSKDLSEQFDNLKWDLTNLSLSNQLPNFCIHAGPIIRAEREYENYSIPERRRILNCMTKFIRSISKDISYQCVHIKKEPSENLMQVVARLSAQISQFIFAHNGYFSRYKVKIYYDNGQTQVTQLLKSVFGRFFYDVEIKNASPSEYRLFQVADMLCTMELIRLKMDAYALSKSELKFFGSERDLKKNYIKPLKNLKRL